MTAILLVPAANDDDANRGTGRVLIYRVALGGYEEISSPDGSESWTEFVAFAEWVTIPDHGPYTPVNRLINAEVALRFPGYACLESTYHSSSTLAAMEEKASAVPF